MPRRPEDADPAENEVTALLHAWREGDPQATERLIPLVYAELHRIAVGYLRRERDDHTLQPTALVHEAYLKLAGKEGPRWKDRVHFYAVAAQLMRRILVDHARSRRAAKRGGGVSTVVFDEDRAASESSAMEILALDEAMQQLAELDARQCRIIELRFFGGLSVEETAQVLEVSTPTVVNDTRSARAWLRKTLRDRADR